MASEPVIALQDVDFSYDGNRVLENVTLTVQAFDFLCVVGPNAGGKTTLLKLLLGLIHPTSGRLRVFGQAPERVRRRMGYMPQHTALDPLFPVSVLDVVLMGRLGGTRLFGPFRRGDRDAARSALEKVGMEDLRMHSFADLSGGQRQRVLIARALASDPELLLLDEPTANVDAVVETEFYEILRQLNDRMTVVLVTHDLGFVSRYVDRVACVNRRVVLHPTSEITGELIHEIYERDVRMVRHDALHAKKNGHD